MYQRMCHSALEALQLNRLPSILSKPYFLCFKTVIGRFLVKNDPKFSSASKVGGGVFVVVVVVVKFFWVANLRLVSMPALPAAGSEAG